MTERIDHIGEWYTVDGAATKLGTTRWRVWNNIKEGNIPALTLGGKALVVQLDDVRRALAKPHGNKGKPRSRL